MAVKINSRLVGFLSGGRYNKDTKKFEIGKFKAGDKFGLNLAYKISKKDGDSRVYGMDIPVTVWLDSKNELSKVEKLIEGMVVVEGYFTPNNWKNKEDKEIKGMQFNCNGKDIVSADSYSDESSSSSEAPVEDEEDNPWS